MSEFDAAQTPFVHQRLASAREQLRARDEHVLQQQIDVTSIPAPTGEEAERADWVRRRFEELALGDISIDSAGNVSGTRKGHAPGEPPIVLLAHLDTVFAREAINGVDRDGARIRAPGIGDNGRGLATMLALAETIDGERVATRRDVQFVATTGEEGLGDLRGAKHFFANNTSVAAAIALDGTGDERIVHSAVGSRRLRVTFHGPGGHSWSDFGVANPLHASAAAVARIASLPLPMEPVATVTVARAGGGISVNAIPQDAWFEIDIRSTRTAAVLQLDTAVRGIAETAVLESNARRRAGTQALSMRIEIIGDRPGGVLDADHPLVAMARSATTLLGKTPELASASTDANIPLSLGIPAITIGGGGLGGDVHTTGEWYDNADGARGIARALTIVVTAAS